MDKKHVEKKFNYLYIATREPKISTASFHFTLLRMALTGQINNMGPERDGSAVKSSSCSPRGPQFCSQGPCQAAHSRLTFQFQGVCCPFLAPAGTGRTRCTDIHAA